VFIFIKEYITLYEMAKFKLDKNIAYILSVIGFLAGWVITFMSFWVPPIGIIDNSVLIVLGQALSFAAGCCGITMHVETKFQNMQQEIDSKQPCTKCREQ
jgi:hypothetical protein